MAGLGYKVWSAGDVLNAADVNNYLADQVTMVFDSSAARGSALGTAVAEGMVSYLKDTDALQAYTTVWRTVPFLETANTFTATQTASALAVTGTAIPSNGIYLPATNALGISTNSAERIRVASTGKIGIGVPPSAADVVTVGQFITGGTSSFGVNISSTISSDVTTAARGFNTFISTAASAFTLVALTHFRASQNAIGAGSSVTAQHGFFVESSLTGATTNYGFTGTLAASGSSRFNLYMSGTAHNHMQGRTGIGLVITDTAQLYVNNAQSASDVTAIFRNFAAQTADAIKVQNSALSDVFSITPAGWIKYISANTAVSAGSLVGYIKIDIGGTEYKVPYYNAS